MNEFGLYGVDGPEWQSEALQSNKKVTSYVGWIWGEKVKVKVKVKK